MPKRIVDGEGIWRSGKLSSVQPTKYRGELANLIPLMRVDGTFEADARLIWSLVYSFNRPEITLRHVEAMLREFERVKLLFRWRAEDGKLWGYFVGVEKRGRLPAPSQRFKEAVGMDVPQELLTAFLAGQISSPYLTATGKVSSGYGGNGNGVGLGKGTGLSLSDSLSNLGNANGSQANASVPPEPLSSMETKLNEAERDTQTHNGQSSTQNEHYAIQTDHSTQAVQLSELFFALVQSNPKASFINEDWGKMWPKDFTLLLNQYSFEDCKRIVRMSQVGNWAKYIVRPFPLLKHAEKILEQSAKLAPYFAAQDKASEEEEPDEQDDFEDESEYEDEPSMEDLDA